MTTRKFLLVNHTHHIRPYLGALVGGGACEGRAVAGGVDGAVGRTVQSAVDVRYVHERVQLLRLLRAQHVRLRVERTPELHASKCTMSS